MNVDFITITKFLNYLAVRLKNNSVYDENIATIRVYKSDLNSIKENLDEVWYDILMILGTLNKCDSKEFNIDFDYTRYDEYCELRFIKQNNNEDFKSSICKFLTKSSLELIKDEKFAINNHDNYNKPSRKNKENKIENSIMWLKYEKKILTINTKDQSMQICRCNPDSFNDNLLKFLLENPNRTWTRKQLTENGRLTTNAAQSTDKKGDKDFYIFLCDINVKGKNSYSKIGDLFFSKDLSKNSIHLKNPIWSELDFEEADARLMEEDESLKSYLSKNINQNSDEN